MEGAMKKKGIWPFRKTWYSFCSKHQDYKKSCPRCNKGTWENDLKNFFSKLLYESSPKAWKWWVNFSIFKK